MEGTTGTELGEALVAVKFSSHPENQGNTVMSPKSSSKSKGSVSVGIATRQGPPGKRLSQQRHQRVEVSSRHSPGLCAAPRWGCSFHRPLSAILKPNFIRLLQLHWQDFPRAEALILPGAENPAQLRPA